jgi:DNA primase large subunit
MEIELLPAVSLLPEPAEKKAPVEKKVPCEKKAMKGTNARSTQPYRSVPSGKMRPCIRGVIDSKIQLDGGQGHAMRVAIAAEARHCGMSLEDTMDLFKVQHDFELLTTIKNINYIWDSEYKRYRCDKLQDQCGSFVKEYCDQCPLPGCGV